MSPQKTEERRNAVAAGAAGCCVGAAGFASGGAEGRGDVAKERKGKKIGPGAGFGAGLNDRWGADAIACEGLESGRERWRKGKTVRTARWKCDSSMMGAVQKQQKKTLRPAAMMLTKLA